MVGPWPLAPHHDYLQYIHHIHLMQWGQNRGVTSVIHFNLALILVGFITQNRDMIVQLMVL